MITTAEYDPIPHPHEVVTCHLKFSHGPLPSITDNPGIFFLVFVPADLSSDHIPEGGGRLVSIHDLSMLRHVEDLTDIHQKWSVRKMVKNTEIHRVVMTTNSNPAFCISLLTCPYYDYI